MIYTLGYNAWSRDEIAAKLGELGAWLADIRFSPRSQRAGFDQKDLQADFPTYVWVQELGNRAFKEGGGIRLLDPQRGVARIAELLATRPVVLLCACRRVEGCHRKVAAELVATAAGLPVVHLLPRREHRRTPNVPVVNLHEAFHPPTKQEELSNSGNDYPEKSGRSGASTSSTCDRLRPGCLVRLARPGRRLPAS